MKLHITLKEQPQRDHEGHVWSHPSVDSFLYDDTNEVGTALTPEELERLVRVWVLAATDSVSVTQQVIDAIRDKVAANTGTLRAAITAIQGEQHG